MKNSLKLFPHMIILTFSQSNSSVLNFECRHQYSQEKSTPKCNYRDSNAVRKISTDLFQWLKDRDSKYLYFFNHNQTKILLYIVYFQLLPCNKRWKVKLTILDNNVLKVICILGSIYWKIVN